MRLFKKTAALVMVVMMLVTAMSSFTLASANAVVDKFEVKEFSVLNSALDAGDVTVNVTLQRVVGNNNTEDSASVIAAIYSDGAMVDVAASTKDYPFYGTTQVNALSLTVPTGTVDPELRVFLWDGDMITPIAKSHDEAKVTGITVGGEALSLVDGTYAYTVNANASAPAQPEIAVVADGLVKATTTWNESVATVVAGDETYTITYAKAQPTIAATYEGAISHTTNSKVWSKTQVLKNPVSEILTASDDKSLDDIIQIEGIPGGYTDYEGRIAKFEEQEAYANRLYNDAWGIIWNVPQDLIGKNRIVYDYFYGGSWSNHNGNANAYYWTITIDADTRIWYSSRQDYSNHFTSGTLGAAASAFGESTVYYLGADGAIGGGDDVSIARTETDYAKDFKFLQLDRTVASPGTFAQYKDETIKSLTDGGMKIYTADLILPEGAETATYVVGGYKNYVTYTRDADSPYYSETAKTYAIGFPGVFCYEFIDSTDESATPVELAVTDVTIKGLAADESVAVAATAYGTAPSTKLLVPQFTERADGNYYAAPQGTAGGTFWSSYLTRCNIDVYPYYHKFPAEMAGAYSYFWKNSFGITNAMTPVVTFTINKDATLYFDTTDEFAAKSGAVALNEGIITRNTNTWNCADSYYITKAQYEGTDTSGETNWHNGRVFKLELKVPEGATSATFDIPLAWCGSQHPYMFIK